MSARAGESWVNALVTFVVPLDDVTVASSPLEKQQAAGRALERFVELLPDELSEHVGVVYWEDAHA